MGEVIHRQFNKRENDVAKLKDDNFQNEYFPPNGTSSIGISVVRCIRAKACTITASDNNNSHHFFITGCIAVARSQTTSHPSIALAIPFGSRTSPAKRRGCGPFLVARYKQSCASAAWVHSAIAYIENQQICHKARTTIRRSISHCRGR